MSVTIQQIPQAANVPPVLLPRPEHPTPEQQTYWFVNFAIKAVGVEGNIGKIKGYIVAFGPPRDSYGEFFRTDCNFYLDWYPGGERPLLVHHGLTSALGHKIGRIFDIVKDHKGLGADGEINLDDPIGLEEYIAIQQRKRGFSLGSVPHMVKVDDTGGIYEWPIVEVTSTAKPAEKYRTTIQAIRAAYEQPSDLVESALDKGAEAQTPEEPKVKAADEEATRRGAFIKSKQSRGKFKMDMNTLISAMEKQSIAPDAILNVLKQMNTGGEDPTALAADAPTDEQPNGVAADVPPMEYEDESMRGKAKGGGKNQPAPKNNKDTLSTKDVQTLIDAAVEKALKAAPSTETVPGASVPKPDQQPRQPQIALRSKWSDMDAKDMSYLDVLRKARNMDVHPIEFYREMADKAQKAYTKGDLKLDVKDANRLMAIKANELNNTGQADDGGDWVPTLWSSDLWERMRVDNNVINSFQSVEMPSPTYELPIESDDPEVYSVAETTGDDELVLTGSSTFTSSKVKTDKVTLISKKLGLQTKFSAEVEEDDIIQFIPQLRNQAQRSMLNALDNVGLNADDTTGTANINYADGNTSSVPKAKFLYGGGDGLRHLALVTNTALGLDFGGAAPTLEKMRQLRFKLLNAYAVRPSDLVYFTDVQTWGKMLNIDELLVFMNNGQSSTVVTGVVPTIDTIPVFPSEELSLSKADGFVSATGSNNDFGTIVCAHKPSWKVGYRRRVTSDVTFLPYYDSYVLTMTVRMAFKNRDTSCVAVGYNIGVA